jgi:hypothetical protein
LKKADSKTLEALRVVGLNGRFSNSVAWLCCTNIEPLL